MDNTRNHHSPSIQAVSYTHLDVYKRQVLQRLDTVTLDLTAITETETVGTIVEK